ncbi:MAG: hypothetical protein A2161_22770 [Candidatus Schekmanbacteria bacterium RBG_13_48_7]|uniref:Addiction module toxin RelE n=1 Tax=Candidatus Schekmanbacteria bacterium RBG_13_48_7 TaxID=1817878 RepID=A0A1F7S3N6_9BACT|nr:MAG: hypothetical protein A2161_22770 [Candidatus Schekmanbacteria bacterium RBG_13_48_7]
MWIYSPEEAVIAIGYATRKNGKREAQEFLEKLYQEGKKREYAKFASLFKMMKDSGKISNPEDFKFLQDGIYEFREHHGPYRLYCFKDEGKIFLTHGCKKRFGKQRENEEIEKAKIIRHEDLEHRSK